MVALARALALALVVALAACGGDDSETGSGGRGDSGGEEPAVDGAELGEAAGEQASEPVDLAVSEVEVPASAAAGVDACGNQVSYDGDLMVDGVSGTTWRIDGDATGRRLTFLLDGPHEVREVGLIPGYAKVDPCDGVDRFVQNRRVTEVTWSFDDGTSVAQTLTERPEMQSLAVEPTTTSTIVLRIDGVTADPERDFTAVSEISLRGT